MASKIFSSIACNLDADILAAALPLFETEKVEAIEWSFDSLYKVRDIPSWFNELLRAYSSEGRLIGHGVFFSLFSGNWSSSQQDWLNDLAKQCTELRFDHITEHFGFMTGKDFHAGAPLNIPYTEATLNIGRDRLKRIYNACRCPVGLENLAFSYSLEDVKRHGEFLEKLVEPVNGFIILDLHNLYCQLHNFKLSFDEVIKLYPLERVREIHLSGGSWESSEQDPARSIRRDTHDNAVPAEVFQLLIDTIPKCPNLKFVVMEQLGTGLKTEESRTAFRNDFIEMNRIIARLEKSFSPEQANNFLPAGLVIDERPAEDDSLYAQQLELSGILENAGNYNEAIDRLNRSSLAQSAWNIEQWDPAMLETAMSIAQKWKKQP